MAFENTDRYGRKIPKEPSQDKPMKRFAESIDRDNLQMFLNQSSSERHEVLFLMMQDPDYAGLSFAKLCKKAGVTLHEMQSLYTDGMRQLALLKMSNALPDLMADVAEDAKSKMEPCPRCDSYGFLPLPNNTTRECPMCDGKRMIRRTGDKQARDLIFESAKLTKQSGPLVAIQQNFNTGDSHLEAILKKTRAITLDKPSMLEEKSQHDQAESSD